MWCDVGGWGGSRRRGKEGGEKVNGREGKGGEGSEGGRREEREGKHYLSAANFSHFRRLKG